MTALLKGQNVAWPGPVVRVLVSDGDVHALLVDRDGRAVAAPAWVGVGTPAGSGPPGVEHLAADPAGVGLDLAALAARAPDVARVLVVVSGWTAPPEARVCTPDDAVVATFAASGLTTERALVLVEVYRRRDEWRIRAHGQGWDGGLAALAAAHHAPAPHAAPTTPSAPTLDPVVQLGMIHDDASRSTAALESSTAFATARLEADLEAVVGDVSLRTGPRGDAARAAVRARADDLVAQARARHTADLTQLTTELADLERSLPAPLAAWTAPAWTSSGWVAPDRDDAGPVPAVRLGEVALAAAPGFRLPMVRRVPLQPPVWVESEQGGDDEAAWMLAALAARTVLATPGPVRLTVVDLGGRGDFSVLPVTPVHDAGRAAVVLHEHLDHLALVALAVDSGAQADLAPEHRGGRVLVLHDVPGGLDASAAEAAHRLVLAGAAYGVQVLLSGRDPAALGVAVLDDVRGACLRVPSAVGGRLVDDVGVTWVFHPDPGPVELAERVRAAAAARLS